MRQSIFLLAILAGFNLTAQHFCHTTEKQNEWFSAHPELKASFDRHQQEAEGTDRELYKRGYNLNEMLGKSAAAGTYTIPVVFHILHQGTGENISDAQVIDAVNILTRDFNKMNADTINVVTQFKNIIGNTKIDFVLATKDPNGNCTNGIIRHWDANTDWNGDFSDYAYTWPATRYLNIYVVRTMGGGAAGYTFLPGSGVPGSMDAIVILSNYVGSIGSGNIYTSRALTHEVGHWLNLPHTWGGTNQPGVACGNDGVSDTPVTKGYTSCNLTNAAICNPSIVENVQNYMDYSYCCKMFTIGQSTRMQNALNSPINGRNNLSSASNLLLTGVTNPGVNCVPNVNITALPSFTVCSGKSLSLSSFTFNANPTTYSWTADNSATVVNPTAAVTSVVFNNPGTTVINCAVANANGGNNQSISVTVVDGTTDLASYNTEGFEGSFNTPPALWKIINPTTPTQSWELTTSASSEGFISMYVPGENLNPNTVEILESPSYDFKHNPGAQFTFKYAYAMASVSNKDLFKVQASKNCGGDWTDIWVPTNLSLSQGSGEITSDLFSPLAYEWKFKSDLTDQPQFFNFLSEENVRFRFYFQEDVGGIGHGNRFYLDEVSFSGPVGINELTRSIDLSVYPNPANSVFNVRFTLSDEAKLKYSVTSVTGVLLVEGPEKGFSTGTHEIKINENNALPAGIYIVNIELNGVKMSKKLIVQ